MPDLKQKLEELKEEYSKTRYNKATNKHLGILRKKIAKIKKDLTKKSKSSGMGFAVKKSGDATVVLAGFPNAGKSSLLGVLTGVKSKVADYAFTTLDVIPGMLNYNGANIQIFDVPGLIEGAHLGKGSGTQVASVIRVADLILFVVDINYPKQLYQLLDELYALDIVVNRNRPNIRIEKKTTGGIEIESNGHKIPIKSDIVDVLKEFRIYNANMVFYEDADQEKLVEALEDNMIYVNALVALNKIDTVDAEYISGIKSALEKSTGMKIIPVSAYRSDNIGALRSRLFENLDIMRIYLKPKGGEPDLNRPLIMKRGSNIFDVAKAINSKIAKELRHALVTGRSVRFNNQKVGKEHVLSDEDIVTIVYEIR